MINSFLLIGQSNMAGRGRPGEVAPINNPDIRMFRDGVWQAAVEPLHTDKPEMAAIGPGMSFAETLQLKSGKTIGLIPCAYGGTALREWQKGERLYEKAVKATQAATAGGSRLKGILWHQGESDSDTLEDANRYSERFFSMLVPMLSEIGGEALPVIIGELGDYLSEFRKGCGYFHIVNRKLLQIAASEDRFSWVSSSGLTDRGDHLHFDAASQRTFGRRYAAAWSLAAQRMQIGLE
jgi:hypothetical protein